MSQSFHHDLLHPFGWENRFEVLERIGSGAMGQVWRARETSTGNVVALKLLDSARRGDEQTLARLEIEGETLMKLCAAGAHENVVPVFDFKITESHACLVMEFIPGLNLIKWCDSQRLDLPARVQLISRVARACGWFHQLGVVHRDLKPANILVSAITLQPVIVDFSIAKVSDVLALTLTNEALGTAPYMASEQFDRRLAPISPATDVYALAATLYELLTHVHPHPGDLTQIIRRHADEVRPLRPCALNPAISRDLECILLKALSHRSQDRYADGTALAEDLDCFLAKKPVLARPISRLSHLGRQIRRRPTLSLTLAACLLLLMALIWDIQRAAQQRHEHEMEARIARLLQNATWSREALQEADALLAELAITDGAQSDSLTRSMSADIVHDIEAVLSKPYLRAEDLLWIHEHALTWLQRQDAVQGARLAEIIQERQRRWKQLSRLSPPFDDTDVARFFGKTRMQVDGGLLFPDYGALPEGDNPRDREPSLGLSLFVTPPFRFDFTFPTPVSKADGLGLSFNGQGVRTVIRLVSPSTAPEAVLKRLDGRTMDTEGIIIVAMRRGEVFACSYLDKFKITGTHFTFQLSIEGRQIDASIDGNLPLHIEDVFTFASSTSPGRISLSWPRGLGLHGLSVATRERKNFHQLEVADLLYNQGKWSAALGTYGILQSVPDLADEARYKTAATLWKLGRLDQARAAWERLTQGHACFWRDISLAQLWAQTALDLGPQSAQAWLLKLSPGPQLTDALRSFLSSVELKKLIHTYRQVVEGRSSLQLNFAEVNDTVKAYQILNVAPVETAANLALALHFNGMDVAALKMFADSLQAPLHLVKDQTEQYAAETALEQWTRLLPSEADVLLNSTLKAWREAYPQNLGIQAVALQEDARIIARSGRLDEALVLAQRVNTPPALRPAARLTHCLLEGCIQYLLKNEHAVQQACRQGVDAAKVITDFHSVHLTDLLALRTLGHCWNRDSCTQLVTKLMSSRRLSTAELGLKSGFVSTYLTNPDFILSLNHLMDSPPGRDLVLAQALHTLPARELIRRWYVILIESFLQSGAFPSGVTPTELTRVQDTAERLVDLLITGQGDEQDLQAYLRAWNDPIAAHQSIAKPCSYSPALVENLKWLLSQRHAELSVGPQAW